MTFGEIRWKAMINKIIETLLMNTPVALGYGISL